MIMRIKGNKFFFVCCLALVSLTGCYDDGAYLYALRELPVEETATNLSVGVHRGLLSTKSGQITYEVSSTDRSLQVFRFYKKELTKRGWISCQEENESWALIREAKADSIHKYYQKVEHYYRKDWAVLLAVRQELVEKNQKATQKVVLIFEVDSNAPCGS